MCLNGSMSALPKIIGKYIKEQKEEDSSQHHSIGYRWRVEQKQRGGGS